MEYMTLARCIFSIFQIQEIKKLFENTSYSCANARGMKCCNSSFLVEPTAGKPLVWPSITFQKVERVLSSAQQESTQKWGFFCSLMGVNVGWAPASLLLGAGRGGSAERVHREARTAALPTGACRITRTQRSHGSSKSQTINSPRFGSVLNAQTVRSAGL